MSFARNFAFGQQIAQTALDTYETAREKSQLRGILEAKPTEIENAYTTQDEEQLRALANAKDANGNPYYSLETNQDGSYGLKANFSYPGQDGQMVQPGGLVATFAPRSRVVEFMGKRYAPEDLNEDRIAGIRARAIADVVAERDPVRGLLLHQSIKADERNDIRFGWERDQQPLKQKQLEQSVRVGEIDLGQKERQLLVQQAEDAAMRMPEDEVRLALTEYLNTNKSDLPLFVLGKTKDGFIMAERNPQTGVLGEQFQVPLSVGRKLVVGRQLAEKGFGKEALQYLTGVDDNINDIIDRYTKTMLDVARVNNDVTYRRGLRDRQHKGVNPDTVKRLNDLWAQISAETDPTKRRELETEYNRLYSIAATEVGKVLPLGSRTNNAKPTPDFKVLPEDGTRVADSNGNVYTYMEGYPVLQGGFAPSQLPQKLSEWGFPPQAEAMVKPMPGGRHIMVPADSDTVYDLSDPTDRKMAREAVNRVTQSIAAARELQARGGRAPSNPQAIAPPTGLSTPDEALRTHIYGSDYLNPWSPKSKPFL